MTIQNPSSIDPRFLLSVMAVLAGLALYHRAGMGHVPHDLSAYLAAADVFDRGLDPYTDAIRGSRHYQGYPYAYPPVTLWWIRPLAWASTALVAGVEWVVRVAVIVGSLRFLGRRMLPGIPLGHLLFAALFMADELNELKRAAAGRQEQLALDGDDEPAARAVEALAARVEKLSEALAARAADA